MRKFAIAMLMSVVVSGTSFAQTKSYVVKNGDTLGAIAEKFSVSTKDIVQANNISNSHKLKLGQKLSIPKASVTTKAVALAPGSYKVRNGDHDWAIAARYGINRSDLRRLNPSVEWTRLQIGQVIDAVIMVIDAKRDRIRLSVRKLERIKDQEMLNEINDNDAHSLGDLIKDKFK